MNENAAMPPIPGRPLRLLRVMHSLRRESGGPAESVRRSTAALLALGHAVEIVTLDGTGAAEKAGWAAEGLTVHALGGQAHGYGFSPQLVPWLRENRTRFDAVLVQGLWKYAGWGVRRALRGSGTPYFVFPHGMLDAELRRVYPVKFLKKAVYWWLREYWVLRDAEGVCFTCEEERRQARGSFYPYRLRERVVAYGTADPVAGAAVQRAAFDSRFPELAGRPFLLFLGRIHSKKGLEELLEAYAVFRREAGAAAPVLVIAGPPASADYLVSLQRRAEKAGLAMRALAGAGIPDGSAGTEEPVLYWLPMITGDVKWGALRACEAFVLLSHQENFGIAVAEALACGKPVLLSKKVNIWQEVAGDRAGFAGADTVAGGLEILRQWQRLADEERAKMGARARACFLHRFEITRAAESLVALVAERTAR